MLGKDVVRSAMDLRGMSLAVLAEKLGYATPSGVSQRLYCKQDMRVDTLAKFLKALDCKIVVKSNLSDKTVWVIDGTSVEEEGEEK